MVPFSLHSRVTSVLGVLRFVGGGCLVTIYLFLIIVSKYKGGRRSSRRTRPMGIGIVAMMSSIHGRAIHFSNAIRRRGNDSLDFPLVKQMGSMGISLKDQIQRKRLLTALSRISVRGACRTTGTTLGRTRSTCRHVGRLRRGKDLTRVG